MTFGPEGKIESETPKAALQTLMLIGGGGWADQAASPTATGGRDPADACAPALYHTAAASNSTECEGAGRPT